MEDQILPSDFKVYVNSVTGTLIMYPEIGFEEKILPTFNRYLGSDGGYVAIYTRDKTQAVYNVGEDIYVVGQIRLKGKYIGPVFYPEGYTITDDISQDIEILEICNEYFPDLKDKMWLGGDTRGWFGF